MVYELIQRTLRNIQFRYFHIYAIVPTVNFILGQLRRPFFVLLLVLANII
jgi:hypothetical protein